MQTGFGALNQTMQEAASRGSFSGSLDYFGLNNGETKVVRFLTDDVITADFASRVRTKEGKYQSFLVPDPDNNLLLRYAPPGSWDGKLVKRTAGVAVLRQRYPVPSQDGFQRMYVQDHVDLRDDGTRGRIFMVIMQGHNNFWDQLVGFFSVYNTICDRDYAITRRGEKLETKYTITPIDPTEADPQMQDPRFLAEAYGYGRPWNKDDPNRYWWCPESVHEWAARYGGEERIKHHLVGEATPSFEQGMATQGAPPAWAGIPTQTPPVPPQWAAPPVPPQTLPVPQYTPPPPPPAQPQYQAPPQPTYGAPQFQAAAPPVAPQYQPPTPPQAPPPQQQAPVVASAYVPPAAPAAAPPAPAGQPSFAVSPQGVATPQPAYTNGAGLGEFAVGTTMNPAPPGQTFAQPVQTAPTVAPEEQDFEQLRARLSGHVQQGQTPPTQ